MKMALRSDISVAIAAVAVLLVIAAAGFAEAQPPAVPDCALKLAACGQFLNSSSPPDTCCNPIKEAVATQLDCLCNLYSSGMLASFGINIDDALHLTKACGVPNDLSKCSKTSSVPAPKQGSTTAGNDAEKLVFTGFASLLLLLASLILY